MKRIPHHESRVTTVSRRAALVTAVASCIAPLSARAQQFPSRPIRLVLGFAPGGGTDVATRLIAAKLGQELNTSVVVENRTGASGSIAADIVVRAEPDGYTLLVAPGSSVTIIPQIVKKPTFNTFTDLAPVNLMGASMMVLAVNPSIGVRSTKDLLQLARTRKLSIASSGTGTLTHLTAEMLSQVASVEFTQVPYKGGGAGITDVLAGNVDGIVTDLQAALNMVRANRLQALAVTGAQPSELLPGIPTLGQEIPGFQAETWSGLFAPAKTPKAVIDKVNAALRRALVREDLNVQLRASGFVPSFKESPAAFGTFVQEEYVRWGKLIKEKNILLVE